MKRQVTTIGILAHVDAGKTTLSEQLLLQAGVLRTAGRVDTQTAMLDYHPIERERGITIYAEQAHFTVSGQEFFLVDTPGHVDFSPEMERTLDILDCAVLVLSIPAGIQPHTRTIWRLLEQRKIPTVLFLNKADMPDAQPEAVLGALEQTFGGNFCDLSQGLVQPVLEQLAMLDEDTLAAYLDDRLSQQQLEKAVHQAVMERRLFPVYVGSALRATGVECLLEGLGRYAYGTYDDEAPAAAKIYKIRHDGKGSRLTLCKLCAGTLAAKEVLAGQKLHELRQYQGQKEQPVAQVTAGQLCALVGPADLVPGDWIDREQISRHQASLCPLVTVQVLLPPQLPLQTALEQLRQLEQEEPTLQVRWNESLQQLQLDTMGQIQLEVLGRTILDRFGWTAQFSEPEVLYRETVTQPVVGIGHYEPLRHYAEVHLLLEPAEAGSGVRFESRCPLDALELHWQRLIETHVLEKQHLGKLVGGPLTDVKVVLLAGRAHEKHTEGGDFRQAVYRAIRQGVMQAQCQLLEPMYRFQAQLPTQLTGKVMTQLQQRG